MGRDGGTRNVNTVIRYIIAVHFVIGGVIEAGNGHVFCRHPLDYGGPRDRSAPPSNARGSNVALELARTATFPRPGTRA